MPANKILLSAARSKATASQLARTLAPEDLAAAIKNLQAAAAKIKQGDADKAARARAANLKKLKTMMDKMGLSAEDVRGLSSKKAPAKRGRPKKTAARKKAGPKKGTKVPPKYAIKVGKETHQWTGRGRMPLVFKEYVEKGGALEKCLIK
jgi:DNA-binding protein H-NS